MPPGALGDWIRKVWPRITDFGRRELSILGIGLIIGIAYQINYYAGRYSSGFDVEYLQRFFNREALLELGPHIIVWLLIWRVVVILLRSIGKKVSATIPISGLVRDLGKFQDPAYDTTESVQAVRIVVYGLRKRARLSAIGANASLLLIVISLLGGLLIFRSAESSAASGQIEGAVRYREMEISNLNFELRGLPELAKDLQLDPAEVKERVQNLQTQLNDARTELRQMSKESLHPEMSYTYLWSVLSTKVGSSLLILFLVQILITLYRYSTRVSAFYEARADALQIASEVDGLSLRELVEALSADKVDFGKSPTPPSQMIFDTIKAGLEKAAEVGAETAKRVAKAH